jgi:hypothetical protein
MTTILDGFFRSVQDPVLQEKLKQHLSSWLELKHTTELSHDQLKTLRTAIDLMHSENFDLQAIFESYSASSKRWLDNAPNDGISYGIRFSMTEPQMFTLGIVHRNQNKRKLSHIRCKFCPDGYFQLYGKGKKLTWDEVLGSLVRCISVLSLSQSDLQRIDLNHTSLRDNSKDLYQNLSSNFSFFDGD